MITYEEAMGFLEDANQYGSVLGLDSMRRLLDRLGNPHDKLKFIHVAGTNGKGSTAAFIATIMAEAGYRVGRYISPSVFGYAEKIQILYKDDMGHIDNSVITEDISEAAIVSIINTIKDVCQDIVDAGMPHPTIFEIETAMSMLYYLQKDCNLVVLEVGLGGRLDATNIINNTECAVITSISMDHMHILGNTLEQIAYEKAGIIKPGIQVVSYKQIEEAENVIEQISNQNHAYLTTADFSVIHIQDESINGAIFTYQNLEHLEIKLLGENQVKNAVVAILTVKAMRSRGYEISDENIRQGLRQTVWRGRFDMIQTQPDFILDGAHNEDAAKSLAKNIEIYFPDKRRIFIVGVLADKDYDAVLKLTGHLADIIITITPNNSRGLKSDILAKTAKKYCNKVIDADKVPEAVKVALTEASEYDVIISFGSFTYLKEVYDCVRGIPR